MEGSQTHSFNVINYETTLKYFEINLKLKSSNLILNETLICTFNNLLKKTLTFKILFITWNVKLNYVTKQLYIEIKIIKMKFYL